MLGVFEEAENPCKVTPFYEIKINLPIFITGLRSYNTKLAAKKKQNAQCES